MSRVKFALEAKHAQGLETILSKHILQFERNEHSAGGIGKQITYTPTNALSHETLQAAAKAMQAYLNEHKPELTAGVSGNALHVYLRPKNPKENENH